MSLRIGIVTDIDVNELMVRVKFEEDNMTSGWLPVLQRSGEKLDIKKANKHTHTIHDTYTGGGTADEVEEHTHSNSVVTTFLPKVNDVVLCAYIDMFNGDGFVLGVIK